MTTEAGLLKVALLHLRTYYLKAVETQLIGMARLNKVSREFMQRFADMKERHQKELASAGGRRAEVRKRQNEEEQRFMVMQTPFFIRGLCPDAVDGSYDEVLKIYVRDVLAVRRNAEMWYVYLTDENVAKARRGEAFQFALAVVALRLFAGEEVEERIEDVTAETAPGIKKELDDLLAHLRQQVMRTANPAVRARMPKSITFDLATRELGDNGWLLAINMPDLGLPVKLASYHARVRNGNAVVNITMSGTYPKGWMTKQLDFFLTAMDERTLVYREE